MFTHDFNVYETLNKLDSLLESGHDDPTPMDRAEYKVLSNALVQGTAELLRHLAMHDALAFKTAESLAPIITSHVSTEEIENAGGFSDEIVALSLPAHLVPYGAIIEGMKTWNVATIETVADLAVLARLWSRYLAAEIDSAEESAIFDEWARQAGRVSKGVLTALQRLDAAGLLRVVDLRTSKCYLPELAALADNERALQLSIVTEPEEAVPRTRLRSPKKTPARRPVSRRR